MYTKVSAILQAASCRVSGDGHTGQVDVGARMGVFMCKDMSAM
jgi:hypothetical protein